MKKIINICFIFLLISQIAFAISDDIDDTKKPKKEEIFEQPIILEPDERADIKEEYNPYTKEALKGIIEKDYDLNSSDGMFHEQLKAKFNKGPIKDIGLQANFINSVGETMDENDSDFKFNPQLINIGIKGNFASEKEGYNLLFDLTPNIHENFFHRLVLDAWVETKRIPHHTLMFGTSRPNVGYEGGQCPYLVPFLNRSQTARNFGNIRKTGVRLKGDYKYVDYDIGGYSSDTYYSEFFPGVETDLWINFKPLANTNGKYGTLNISGGYQAGVRNSVDFNVTSMALRYNYKKFKLSSELQYANGSNGNSGLNDAQQWGYNITLAYQLTKKLEILLRYDDFDPNKKIAKNNTKEYTAGINYFILGQTLRVMLNYIYAQNDSKPDSHRILLGTQVLI